MRQCPGWFFEEIWSLLPTVLGLLHGFMSRYPRGVACAQLSLVCRRRRWFGPVTSRAMALPTRLCRWAEFVSGHMLTGHRLQRPRIFPAS